MNLTYRGISYKQSLTYIQTEKTGQTANYRGQTYQVSATVLNINKPSQELISRGIKSNQGIVKKVASPSYNVSSLA